MKPFVDSMVNSSCTLLALDVCKLCISTALCVKIQFLKNQYFSKDKSCTQVCLYQSSHLHWLPGSAYCHIRPFCSVYAHVCIQMSVSTGLILWDLQALIILFLVFVLCFVVLFLGEVGLLVCKISRFAPFSGYEGAKSQTEKKKLRDVFRKGDLYCNSGDLLIVGRDNFIYFHDRVGDTFRLVCFWNQKPISMDFE